MTQRYYSGDSRAYKIVKGKIIEVPDNSWKSEIEPLPPEDLYPEPPDTDDEPEGDDDA